MPRRTRKFRLRRLIWCVAAGILIAGIAGVVLYGLYLDRIVTQQFQGRRWTLPAQVFAAPLELYVGAPVSMSDLTRTSQLSRVAGSRRDFIPQSKDVERSPSKKHALV